MAERNNNVSPRAVIDPIGSSDQVWFGEEMEISVTDKINEANADIAELQSGKANVAHAHSDYAPTTHGHTDYAPVSHEHSGYADSDHTHTDYASSTHTHSADDVSGLADVATSGSYNDLTNKPTIPEAYSHPASHPASMITGLADVATSGDYEDLTNKPTIPAAYTHPESHPASMITDLADVATSGSYNDLSDKPTIPTVPTSLPANGGNADTVDNKHASDFASASHNHDDDYAGVDHTHTQYAETSHTHSNYASATHNHDTNYAGASHTHAQSEISGLETALSGKANTSHSHSQYATAANLTALETTVSGKADASHTHAAATTSAAGFMSAADKTKLNGIATGANAYTHPTTSGNKHIPSGGSSGQILRWSADGTAVWGADNNTTYSNATTSAAGLMSASDKSKLDGIATGANKYTLPTASSTLGGVKTTSTVTSTSGLTPCPIISGVPYYKDTNSTYSLSSFGVTATAAELNKLDGVTATATELNYVDGVTSNIQTQLNGKANSSHTHSYLPLSGGTVNGDTNIAGILRVNGQQSFYFQTSTMSQTVGTNNATGGTTICCGSSANVAVNGANLMTPNCLPKSTNTYYCGNNNFRWKGIYSAAAVNVSSDERLKENIEDVNADEAVNLINGIDVKSFNYIGNDEPQIGVMAQDILAKSPELAKALVTEGEDGYYGVKTSDLVFPLIIAVQRLQKEIEELKNNKK